MHSRSIRDRKSERSPRKPTDILLPKIHARRGRENGLIPFRDPIDDRERQSRKSAYHSVFLVKISSLISAIRCRRTSTITTALRRRNPVKERSVSQQLRRDSCARARAHTRSARRSRRPIAVQTRNTLICRFPMTLSNQSFLFNCSADDSVGTRAFRSGRDKDGKSALSLSREINTKIRKVGRICPREREKPALGREYRYRRAVRRWKLDPH